MNSERKIRLLILTPTLQCGGSEKFVAMLCNHIDTGKFAVRLAVMDNTRPFYTIKNPSIEVTGLQKKRVRYALFSIKKTVKEFQPDIIFSTANHLNLYLAIFRNSFPRSTRFVARESSIVSINSGRAPIPALYNRLIKKYYRRFDKVICQSAYMQQDLTRHYDIPANQTVVLHNAVENDRQERNMKNVRVDRVYKFITVSRLSEEKGIERLIHAVGLLSVRFRLFIIGDGNKKDQLQKLINELQLQDKVILQGEKTHPFAGMEEADLFLMGSYYEGFPNTLLEAQALGIPVVAFNAPGGISEIISSEENGLLADDNDILGFAAAIKRALSVNFDRDRIIESTQKRFSAAVIFPRLEEILLALR